MTERYEEKDLVTQLLGSEKETDEAIEETWEELFVVITDLARNEGKSPEDMKLGGPIIIESQPESAYEIRINPSFSSLDLNLETVAINLYYSGTHCQEWTGRAEWEDGIPTVDLSQDFIKPEGSEITLDEIAKHAIELVRRVHTESVIESISKKTFFEMPTQYRQAKH